MSEEVKKDIEIKEWEKRFRELTEDEEKIMFLVFCRNFGNHSMTARDPDSIIKDNSCIGYWARIYDWHARMRKETQERLENQKKEIESRLLEGKYDVIRRAFWLVKDRRVKKTSMLTGVEHEVDIEPTSKDVKIAYEIIKTELGEPSSVRHNLNTNEVDQDTIDALDAINKLIQGDDKKQPDEPAHEKQDSTPVSSEPVQDGAKTSGDCAEVSPSI